MDMMVGNLTALSTNPIAWVVVGLVVLKALHSLYLTMRCPVMRGEYEPSDTLIEEAKNYKVAPPPSYLVIMLGGMGLATGGLYMLQDTTYGPLALGAIVVGIFMFLTEPSRLFANASKMDVFASTHEEGERNELARDRLRSAYMERATYEVVIAIVLIALLLMV